MLGEPGEEGPGLSGGCGCPTWPRVSFSASDFTSVQWASAAGSGVLGGSDPGGLKMRFSPDRRSGSGLRSRLGSAGRTQVGEGANRRAPGPSLAAGLGVLGVGSVSRAARRSLAVTQICHRGPAARQQIPAPRGVDRGRGTRGSWGPDPARPGRLGCGAPSLSPAPAPGPRPAPPRRQLGIDATALPPLPQRPNKTK